MLNSRKGSLFWFVLFQISEKLKTPEPSPPKSTLLNNCKNQYHLAIISVCAGWRWLALWRSQILFLQVLRIGCREPSVRLLGRDNGARSRLTLHSASLLCVLAVPFIFGTSASIASMHPPPRAELTSCVCLLFIQYSWLKMAKRINLLTSGNIWPVDNYLI